MTTDYHAKYFAHELTRAGGKGLDRISQSLFNASVDLNPHQVEAALFALRSPLSNGVMLADEVGLGKTIEAGLVLSQYWAERKRSLLVICPAALRKQWQIELEEKFHLPARIMDARRARLAMKEGAANPFESNEVIITSFHYASRMASEVRQVDWHLCVIDEAHKLRNSYRPSSKMGQNLRFALEETKKVLLTATPLQNSLSELYGLASLIDDRIFGDFPTFRTTYMKSDGDIDDLRERLKGFSKRTLRKDVLEYIKFTRRNPITIKFRPTDDEHNLYNEVSAFLQREDTYALPAKQRHLTIIIVRKVLASSPVALAGTLGVIRDRLIGLRDNAVDTTDITDRILAESDMDEDLFEQLMEEMDTPYSAETEAPAETIIDKQKLEKEIEDIDRFILWARSLGIDTKTKHLLKALDIGYKKMAETGAAEKAVVFTESRRTQEFLKNFLEAHGHAGQVVTFSGTMKDQQSKDIYQRWLEENKHTGRRTGSRAVDLRQAIIDHFRGDAKILIATEAAAEGINLQFCSLVINFDLPWNPQRVEQRIGRCHRYGQKHDVVVINFLNEKNEADRRVFDLLTHKFKLFDGIFGASDEILGRLDSSASFESRIIDIYQKCRSLEEIEEAFSKLQEELDQQIQLKLQDTREQLLEHFDEDVHLKLKVDYEEAVKKLDAFGRMFWRLSHHMLADSADFCDETLTFNLTRSPIYDAPLGKYHLIQKGDADGRGQVYRLSHPLGEHVVGEAKELDPGIHLAVFDLSSYASRISVLEQLKGQSGWLLLSKLHIQSLDDEELLLFTGITDTGDNLEPEVLEKLFKLDASTRPVPQPEDTVLQRLNADSEQYTQAAARQVSQENNIYFQEKREQLYRWADDVVKAAENDIHAIKMQVRAAEREARDATTVAEQKEAQEKIRQLEKKKRSARRRVFEIEDEIEAKRDELITRLEEKMIQNITTRTLFILRWTII